MASQRERGTAVQPSERAPERARHGDVAPTDLTARVWDLLQTVHDPEIPTISVVDLGIVHHVEATPARVRVEILPTFVGCPALDVMRETIQARLLETGLAPEVSVGVSFAEPWSSDRITPTGHAALRAAGFAPPAEAPSFTADDAVDLNPLGRLRPPLVPCPHCGSRNTLLENRFGPTLCRSIYYCNNCRQPFEAFKPV